MKTVKLIVGSGPVTNHYTVTRRKVGRKWVADIVEDKEGGWTQTTKPFSSEPEAISDAIALITIHDNATSIGGEANDCA